MESDAKKIERKIIESEIQGNVKPSEIQIRCKYQLLGTMNRCEYEEIACRILEYSQVRGSWSALSAGVIIDDLLNEAKHENGRNEDAISALRFKIQCSGDPGHYSGTLFEMIDKGFLDTDHEDKTFLNAKVMIFLTANAICFINGKCPGCGIRWKLGEKSCECGWMPGN